MSEHCIQAGDEGSGIRVRVRESSTQIQAITGTPNQGQIAPLSRAMCAPLVRLADQVALVAAVVFSLFSASIQHNDGLEHFLQLRISMRNLLLQIVLLMAWRFLFWVAGTYQPRLNPAMTTLLWRVPMTAALCTGLLFPLLLWARPGDEVGKDSLLFWFIATILMLSVRTSVLVYESQIRPAFRRRRTVVICGTGVRARAVVKGLPAHRDFKYQLAGFVDTRMQAACSRLGPMLGNITDLEDILMHQPIDEVIVALPIKSHFSEIEQIVDFCGRAGIQIQYPLLNLHSDIAKNHTIGEDEGTRMVLQMVHNDHRLLLKNALDRVAAAMGLVVLAPVFLIIAAAIKLSSKGPVFFVQQRFGLGKRTFGMIKFRSMVVDAEARMRDIEHMNENQGPTFKIKRDPRVTRVGAILRRTSLDELPQLINVLLGDMSLVGPRPLPLRDVELFSEPWLMRRFSVKPGITGLWQVSGRSNTEFAQAIKLDLRYIDHWSLLMDLKILLCTFSAVFRGDGAY